MRLAAPEWLLLLPALAVAARLYPRLGLRRALRALAVGAVALALAGPEVSSRSSGLDLWVLVDRSDSAAWAVAEGLPEWARLLDATRGRDDRVRWVAFGAAPQVMQDPLRERFEGGADATRLGLALRAAAAAQDPGRANRVLLLSDGYATDDVAGATAALMEAETAVDVRWVLPPEVSDVAVRRLEAPDRVAEGEAVLVEAELAGTHAGPVPFTLERDGRVIHAGEATLDKGVARVRLQDRPGSVGAHRYTLRLRPKGDGVPGNDAQERWVEVEGGPRLVLITSYPEGPLQAALRAGGYRVEVLGPEAADVGRLSGAAAVILEDVPAHRLSRELLAALPLLRAVPGGRPVDGGRQVLLRRGGLLRVPAGSAPAGLHGAAAGAQEAGGGPGGGAGPLGQHGRHGPGGPAASPRRCPWPPTARPGRWSSWGPRTRWRCWRWTARPTSSCPGWRCPRPGRRS